jgi:hypothetical protein
MASPKHKTQTIPIGRLLLDTRNPRHEPVESQREAIFSLIARERHKLVVLASDIKDYGLSPADRLLVIRSGRNYTVLDGNRRMVAIKLLANPRLAEHTIIATSIKRIARDATPPREAECSVLASREDAKHWMELRHGGEKEGAGTVGWNTLARHRFASTPGSHGAKAISFLEAVNSAYPTNEVIQELSTRVAEKRLTTLGRVVADPNFRTHTSMSEEFGIVRFSYPAPALQQFIETLLGDIAADLTVSQLKSKAQRAKYLSGMPKPSPQMRLPEPKPLVPDSSEPPSKAKQPTTRPKPAKPPAPLQELCLDKLGAKTQALLREFQRIDADRSPNASAVLARAILELSVDAYIDARELRANQALRKRVEACLKDIDPRYTSKEYQALRTGLKDGTSLYAVATLHAFVHNPHYHADGTTVRSIAANIQPFLQALNDRA